MPTQERPLRADAQRNRRRILDAARVLFAERGLTVTLDEIAREAGLGVGTVYRRFPSREALVEALFQERLGEMVALAREALDADDAWEGLRSFIERSVELQAADRGFKELVLGTDEGREHVARIREQMIPLATGIAGRAQAAGAVRADFAPQDFPLLQMMVGAVVDVSIDVEPELWRRYLALLLDGLRSPVETLPVPPLDYDQVPEVMSRWRPPARAARPARGR